MHASHAPNTCLYSSKFFFGGWCILLSFCSLSCSLNCSTGLPRGLFCDVFSYGVILVELIAKIAIDKEKLRSIRDLPDEWARSVYKPGCSLVEKSLEKDAGYHATDGPIITKLAMHCVEYHPKDRPTMKEVVEQLQSLQVVQLHGDEQKKKTFMLMH